MHFAQVIVSNVRDEIVEEQQPIRPADPIG